MNNKINLNEQKTQNKNLLIKLAETVGNQSVGKCGIWFNQPVVPMYTYNDDGAGNLQAKLNVKYKDFFSKETEFIIISSPYNLSKTGKYTIDINGLDTKHGVLFL